MKRTNRLGEKKINSISERHIKKILYHKHISTHKKKNRIYKENKNEMKIKASDYGTSVFSGVHG